MRRAALVAIAAALLGAGCSDKAAPTRTIAAAASQSPADARRDGVVAKLAALPLRIRSDEQARMQTREGVWVLSGATDELNQRANESGCGFGDANGVAGVDVICTVEYGEILLLDARGNVKRAYPMPAVPPRWIFATDDAIYAGAVGDGALTTSTFVRIDRADLRAAVVLFHAPGDLYPGALFPNWRLASPAETAAFRAGAFDGTETTGKAVTSSIGPRRINVDAIARLFG